jgi:hypothetical protein
MDVVRHDRLLLRVIIVWLVVMVGVQVVGFFIQEELSKRIEREALVRANDNCEAVNELRHEIVGFLSATPPWPPFPDGMDQPTIEWLTAVAEQQQSREVDAGVFVPRDCPPSPEGDD